MSEKKEEPAELESRPGGNCWRVGRVENLQLLPSGRHYFSAFREAVKSAEKRVVVIGWDLDTRVSLHREDECEDNHSRQLGPFLEELLEEKPELEVYLLVWDFSIIYAAEREWKPLSETLRSPHPRLHYEVDGNHPVGASHHQKIVLVDDRIAFLGGIDLSAWRWDSPERKVPDSRRHDPHGKPYDPYHDIQAVFSGELVESVRELCEYRWKRGTGSELPSLPGLSGDPVDRFPWETLGGWIEGNGRAALSRTFSAWQDEPEIREIHRWHLDAIAGARHCLYIENQYFSARSLKDAILSRVKESGGPEVIIVLNEDTGGWMEESTMGVMRDVFFRQLIEADHENRLRLLHPVARRDDGSETTSVYVHAKVLIVDDGVVKIGSSNLSNRSMFVDSEIDLILEPGEDGNGWGARTRNRLLAIHLGTDEETVSAKIEEAGSVVRAIDQLRSDSGTTLLPIEPGPVGEVPESLSESGVLDPEEPIDPRHWIRQRIRPEESSMLNSRIVRILSAILILGAIGFSLKYGWEQLFREFPLDRLLETLQSSPWAPVGLVATFVVASLLGVPINVLLLALAVAIQPWLALAYGYVGSHLGALAGFGMGRGFGDRLLRRLGPERKEKLERRLQGGTGVASVAILRVLPIAPFVVVNVAAGASPLKWSTFNWGTLLGMLPGMTAVIFLTDRFKAFVEAPGWGNGIVLGLGAIVIGLLVVWIRGTLSSAAAHGSGGRNSSSST